jgi:hypothetical protein
MLAVISYEYWTMRFDRAADVLGRILTVDNRNVTIVGVTGPGFHGLDAGTHSHITLPISVMALDEPAFLDAQDGWTYFPHRRPPRRGDG